MKNNTAQNATYKKYRAGTPISPVTVKRPNCVTHAQQNRIFILDTGGGDFVDKQVETAVLPDLFNRTASRLLWETSSHAAINARRLSVNKHPLQSIQYPVAQLSKPKQLYNELPKVRHRNTCEPEFISQE